MIICALHMNGSYCVFSIGMANTMGPSELKWEIEQGGPGDLDTPPMKAVQTPHCIVCIPGVLPTQECCHCSPLVSFAMQN